RVEAARARVQELPEVPVFVDGDDPAARPRGLAIRGRARLPEVEEARPRLGRPALEADVVGQHDRTIEHRGFDCRSDARVVYSAPADGGLMHGGWQPPTGGPGFRPQPGLPPPPPPEVPGAYGTYEF